MDECVVDVRIQLSVKKQSILIIIQDIINPVFMIVFCLITSVGYIEQVGVQCLVKGHWGLEPGMSVEDLSASYTSSPCSPEIVSARMTVRDILEALL